MGKFFDWRSELDNIATGMHRDLQRQVGQTVSWFLFDRVSTQTDAIYDVGATPAGRQYLEPRFVPCLGVIKLEGRAVPNERGFYVVDTLRFVFSADAIRKASLDDVVLHPDRHDVDRIAYENKVFAIQALRVRGVLTAGYAVCAADCMQVKHEELINDPTFQQYIPTDDG